MKVIALNFLLASLPGLALGGPEVFLGEGEACKITYNSNADKFQKVKDYSCDDGLVCTYDGDTGDVSGSVQFDGVCETETCGGPADPDSVQDTGTTRVTICHRTCSKTNPWVRITIDDDAWGGADASGCGHALEHDVEEDCNVSEEELVFWGVRDNYKDYEIKVHGTKEEVRAANGWSGPNDPAEKAYWKYWERACPAVRNGACCTEGVDCCGEDMESTPDTPAPVPDTPAPTKGKEEPTAQCLHLIGLFEGFFDRPMGVAFGDLCGLGEGLDRLVLIDKIFHQGPACKELFRVSLAGVLDGACTEE